MGHHTVDPCCPPLVRLPPLQSMNHYAGLAKALWAGIGIGELPPLVRPELVREGRLVEVMPKWSFPTLTVALVNSELTDQLGVVGLPSSCRPGPARPRDQDSRDRFRGASG
jgi:DNA-binding transcriptional LysR family regulator